MSLEVVAQLPGGDEDWIKQLVDLQVPCLGLMEDLADVVHWMLDSSDPPGGAGVWCVYFHWCGIRVLLILWVWRDL
jgi:hypothetical protein